ncbi:hypothetical protein CLIB1423_10S04390 [[Candida] railenensis]|uniref:N-acetyltransferase domain-containing protein n=1 Tax=[Candida] railenensis TaxID=45579 RepID=A0A9P0VZD2_9ASCO|nr:hypothetical protein CLIB1423_10S04390 [[Candida] railenensis]
MTTFHSTTVPEVLHELFSVAGEEWAGNLTVTQFADEYLNYFKKLEKNGKKPKAHFVRDRKSNDILSIVIVHREKGYYKNADRAGAISSSAPPSAESIGVDHITMLLVSFVFTVAKQRGKGLAESLIKRAIESTEQEIIDQHIALSKPEKKDNFKTMVTDSNGKIDTSLAHYYLSKKYFWYLYSIIGTFYERFGFKEFPLEVYKIPSAPNPNSEELLKVLLDGAEGTSANQGPGGKKLRFLKKSNPQDLGLIEFIFQTKELEIVTELNKNISHSELGSGRSQSSLANMSDILSVNKLSSATELLSLGSISEAGKVQQEKSELRRKSSILHSATPKVAIKPEFSTFDIRATVSIEFAKASKSNAELATKYADIQGAVLTNELQQKTHYVLWSTLLEHKLVIIAMGELKSDFFSSVFESGAGVGGGAGAPRRRGSSFTGINDLGGHNFQDLDILFQVAGYVARHRQLPEKDYIYAAVNDLPTTIPVPVLHDYLLNFVNSHLPADSKKVEFFSNGDEQLGILPMMKKFGQTSSNVDIDWVSNGVWSFGW